MASYLGVPILRDVQGRVSFDTKQLLEGEFESEKFAAALDRNDPLASLRNEFIFPPKNEVYFVGNSLGLQPRGVAACVGEVLSSWADLGVSGHFSGHHPWLNYDEDLLVAAQAKLVGAIPAEVALMNSLTVNLHLLLTRFYTPITNGRRKKILIEEKAFPSDFYAIESQIRSHGLDPAECILEIAPRVGENVIRTEDVLAKIAQHGPELAVVVMSGLHYYTGQLFEIPEISKAVHAVGGSVIWDLAHAVGNVDLCLHDWEVDGAVWCTYKYMNSGPGGIGGFFIHESHFNKAEAPRLAGWWGHNVTSRFEMNPKVYEGAIGASEFRLSNVPILTAASLLGSLQVFEKTDMQVLRAKSMLLTGYLHKLLHASSQLFTVITPAESHARGSQLSLLFENDKMAKTVTENLEKINVIVDYRKPGLVRVAPVAMYSSFSEVLRFVQAFNETIIACSNT